MRSFNIALAGTALAALFGCSSSGRVEVSVSSRPLEAPPGRAAPHLLVTVDRVEVHVASEDGTASEGTAQQDPAQGQDSLDWTTVFSGQQTIDLYDVDATSKFLGSATVPAGRVTQVRLVLEDDVTLQLEGGVALPVACPSCTETGIKIVPHGTLTVPDGGTLQLTLDFDQPASLQTAADGSYRLDPVIRL